VLKAEIRTGVVNVPGLELFYEDRGGLADPVIVLIMGLGAQLTVWPELLCDILQSRGFRVIRFDNRDIGLSSSMSLSEPLNTVKNFVRSKLGMQVKAPYDLYDMADDAMVLLDSLEVERAHIVGASMGGMIAQLLAASYPHRVLSLTSIMSNTNEPHLPTPDLRVLFHLVGITGEKVVDAASAVSNRLVLWGMIKSPVHHTDKDLVAERAEKSYLRAFRPEGAARHSMAVMATGGFAARLKSIVAPTLVIHGNKDRLVPLAGGMDSVRAIPGARLHVIDGMGHDLPDSLCAHYADLIIANANKAQ